MNRFSVAHNNFVFAVLLLLTPAIFAGMFIGSESALAAVASAVAYLSIVIGERLEV